MTLHITYISGQYVLQVSDRLVTRDSVSGPLTFDLEANKTVVYIARDALVSIGYAGLAYLNHRPTDQWIAEKLIGEEVGSRARIPGGGIPEQLKIGATGPWHELGSAMRLLREELVVARDLHSTPRCDLPRLIIAGWQLWKRRARPVAYIIADDGKGPLYQTLIATPRYDWLRGVPCLNFTPSNRKLHRIATRLSKELKSFSIVDEVEQRMMQILRVAANQPAYIGKDYLSVLLPPPAAGFMRIRYVASDASATQARKQHEDLSPYIGPVGFAPWIVTPRYEAGPSLLVNSQAWTIDGLLGDLSLEMEGPPAPPNSDFLRARVSQRPRPWPRGKR